MVSNLRFVRLEEDIVTGDEEQGAGWVGGCLRVEQENGLRVDNGKRE